MKTFAWFVGLFKEPNGNGNGNGKSEEDERPPEGKKQRPVVNRESQKLRIDIKELSQMIEGLNVEIANEVAASEGGHPHD